MRHDGEAKYLEEGASWADEKVLSIFTIVETAQSQSKTADNPASCRWHRGQMEQGMNARGSCQTSPLIRCARFTCGEDG